MRYVIETKAQFSIREYACFFISENWLENSQNIFESEI